MLINSDLIDAGWFWLMLIGVNRFWLMPIDSERCWLNLRDAREWHKPERTHIPWTSIFSVTKNTQNREMVAREGEGSQ